VLGGGAWLDSESWIESEPVERPAFKKSVSASGAFAGTDSNVRNEKRPGELLARANLARSSPYFFPCAIGRLSSNRITQILGTAPGKSPMPKSLSFEIATWFALKIARPSSLKSVISGVCSFEKAMA
jgi:hypothetical protein